MILGLMIRAYDSSHMIHGIIREYHSGRIIPSIIIPSVRMLVGQ